MQEKLRNLANKSYDQYKKIATWRLLNNKINLFKYIIWRNKLPIIFNFITRSLTALELYLLYYYFYRSTLSGVIIILFILFSARQIYQGIIQYFREKIVKADLEKRYSDWSHLYFIACFSSIFFGLLLVSVLASFIIITRSNVFDISFSLIWLILFPLELLSVTLWSIAYSLRRVYRSFLPIILLRLSPCIILLLLGSKNGVFCYLIAVLISRLVEYTYLILRAYKQLKILGKLPSKPSRLLQKMYNTILDPSIWKRVSFTLPIQIYNTSIILILSTISDIYVYIYFFIHQIVSICTYPIFRIAQSLGMDLFLALKSANSNWANFIYRQSKFAILVTSIFILTILSITLILLCNRFLILFGDSFLYVVYAIPLTLALGFHRALTTLQLWSGTETYLTFYNWTIFCLLGLVSQIIFILIFRADIAMVLFIELAIFTTALFPLSILKINKHSPMLKANLDKEINLNIIRPKNWLTTAIKEVRKNKPSLLYIGIIKRFQNRAYVNNLLGTILTILPKESVGTKVSNGAYLYLLPNIMEEQVGDIIKNLASNLGGHLYALECINCDDKIINRLQTIAKKILGKDINAKNCMEFNFPLSGWHASREMRSISNFLIKPNSTQKVLSVLNKIRMSGNNFYQAIVEELNFNNFYMLPRIEFTKDKIDIYGEISYEFANYAYKLFAVNSTDAILIKRKAPFIVFSLYSQPIILIDAKILNARAKSEIIELAYTFNLALMLNNNLQVTSNS